MGVAKQIPYLLCHPSQLRAIIQWKLWHDPVHSRDKSKETPSEKACFHYLNMTSRSFASVIQELTPELLMPVCLFYLVLRGLDTVEDDMTLDLAVKEPLLRQFHEKLELDGWTFDQSGPNEKDRDVLVHFDQVIVELKKTKRPYFEIIKDITVKMGNGMADYATNAEHNVNGVETVADYVLYCHYVAGLVGEGLTRLFVESELARPQLLERMELSESMGQFLQKTNIIRDVHEDFLDKRRFWPKEIWSKYVDNWDDLFDPKNRSKALECSSDMVLNALRHAEDCLYYMSNVREQSIFNFVAIPQTMAIATLELVFRNPAIFHSHIKITKGDACQIMMDSTQSLRQVCDVFKHYVRRIHQKNDPRDPHFLAISSQCGKIEQYIESIFPKKDANKRQQEPGLNGTETVYLMLTVLGVLFFVAATMIGTAWFFGARFDLALQDASKWFGQLKGAAPSPSGHQEL